MTHPIINIADIELETFTGLGMGATPPAPKFGSRRGAISTRIGAQKLGYNLTELPPGKRAFPRHSHRINEEMFFVLDGEGEVQIGDARFPVRRGDVIACPPGGPETAHQIVNTSASAELRFLAISTMLVPEIVDYPDSGKIGVRTEVPPGADGKPRTVRFLTRAGVSLDYWDGE